MKRIFTSLLLAIFAIGCIKAQEAEKKDTAWKAGGQFVFTLSQASFTNWAAGGQDSRTGNSRLGLFGNYIKGNIAWENNLDLAYGLSKQGLEKEFRKIDDILELNSKLGLKATEKWYYSILFNAKTQFSEGRKYLENDSSIVISDFASPLNINLAVGADYKPNKFTSLFLSPINSKIMYVNDTSLSVLNSLDPGQTLRYELGFIAKFKYQKDVVKNINFMTKLDLFADYLQFESFKDVDVSWEILLTMKVFKVISVNLNTHMIWDNNIKSTKDDGSLGDPKIQFKEIFGAGISYKF
jgi:hypothetical protein